MLWQKGVNASPLAHHTNQVIMEKGCLMYLRDAVMCNDLDTHPGTNNIHVG